MRVVVWLIRAFIFFTLFAFALNNQQAATVRWFFGVQWQAPMVIIVLVAFACGCAIGVLAMVPAWWKHRRVARRQVAPEPAGSTPATAAAPTRPPDFSAEHPPREGL
jgi:lipopolysaccharide assembly protein A